jgi:hypothetical protein
MLAGLDAEIAVPDPCSRRGGPRESGARRRPQIGVQQSKQVEACNTRRELWPEVGDGVTG